MTNKVSQSKRESVCYIDLKTAPPVLNSLLIFVLGSKPLLTEFGIHLTIQCPLGFATLDKAAALALATSRAVTDLSQYINSDLGYSDLKICFFCSK